MDEANELKDTFKLKGMELEVKITGDGSDGNSRYQLMHEIWLLVESKKKPRKQRAKKGADKNQTEIET